MDPERKFIGSLILGYLLFAIPGLILFIQATKFESPPLWYLVGAIVMPIAGQIVAFIRILRHK
jgi:hypothetical protein